VAKDLMRVQFDIPKDKVKFIDDMADNTSSGTRKEVINSALALLEWAIRERQSGHIIASVDEENKKYKELYMPILSNVSGCVA